MLKLWLTIACGLFISVKLFGIAKTKLQVMRRPRVRFHLPLMEALVAAIAVYTLSGIYLVQTHSGIKFFPAHCSWAFVIGVAYIYAFEPTWHRFPMHEIVKFYKVRLVGPVLKWLCEGIRNSHSEHHRAFEGQNFRNDDPERHQQVTTLWWVFPTLYLTHFAAFLKLLPGNLLTFLPMFFLGVLMRFLAYEITHKFTHAEEDNILDKLINKLSETTEKVPIIGTIFRSVKAVRAEQIEYHRAHHKTPNINFDFVPPYIMRLVWNLTARLRKTNLQPIRLAHLFKA